MATKTTSKKVVTDPDLPTVSVPVAAVPTKPFYESKTLWVNLVGLIIIILQYTGSINLFDPKLLALILVIANTILRFLTDKPLSLS